MTWLAGDEANLKEPDQEWVAKLVEDGPGAAPALEKTRQLGAGLLREVVEQGESLDPKRAAGDRRTTCACAPTARCPRRTSGRSRPGRSRCATPTTTSRRRKKDVDDHARDSVDRLERTWIKFKELEVQEIISDEALFRELRDRFGSAWGFGEYFTGGMGAEAIRELLRSP